ncbi:MAG: hypothetical protein IPN76_21625 [Saprospiraceae bacterium]|nr:hypothetical protein [Saprospiraceae bacterium]
MKRLTYLVLAAFAATLFCFSCNKPKVITESGNPSQLTKCFCTDSTRCGQLCSMLPFEPDLTDSKLFPNGYQATLDSVHQPPFDQFSWQAFVALNWPAGQDGKPLTCKITDSLDNKRVWEYYPDSDVVFGDTTGCATCNTNCEDLFVRVSKGKFTVNPDGSFTEADGHALIDKNLNFVVYDIKVNAAEATYINQLKAALPNVSEVNFPTGAIELKTAWRILDTSKGDDPSRYYSRNATIYVPAGNSKSGQALCIPATIGLVGFHIAFKVPNENHLDPWIWATFEQVDNVPSSIDDAQMARQRPSRYSFYNPYCINCPINTAPAGDNGKFMWAPTPPYAIDHAYQVPKGEGEGTLLFGTQVVRDFPIYYTTQLMNSEWQSKLAGTPFEYYQLVGTQWGTTPDGPPFDSITFVPHLLANTTQETYFQTQPIASCGACHGFANLIIGKDTLNADHSFLLGNLNK